MAAPGWVALGGKSRKYRNEATGEVVSRREYDKRAGRFGPRSEHVREGIRTPEELLKRRKTIQAPPGPPQWGRWFIRSFSTLEAAITFARSLGHVHTIVSAHGLFTRTTDSGTTNAPGWASTPTFFADQFGGEWIADRLSFYLSLSSVDEAAVKWKI